jgi:hypothetical protein
MKKLFGRSVPLVMLIVISGCTRTNAALMDNSVRLARTCPDGVKIYSSADKVGSEYQEIALLNSTGSSGFTSEAGMMKSRNRVPAQRSQLPYLVSQVLQNEKESRSQFLSLLMLKGSHRSAVDKAGDRCPVMGNSSLSLEKPKLKTGNQPFRSQWAIDDRDPE